MTMPTARRRRRIKPNKPAAEEPRPAGPTTLHDLPDHLIPLILVRLDSSVTLLRAAATCKPWRRIIADTGFLNRNRALRGPCVAGHYHAFDPDWVDDDAVATGNPVFLPSSSCTFDSRRFSLDFLQRSDDRGWAVANSCGSLLLLVKRRAAGENVTASSRYDFPDLLVCDPLIRRYQMILRPEPGPVYTSTRVFLLHGDGRRIDVSDFRVLSVLHEHVNGDYRPVVCMFSPGNDGGWQVLPPASTNTHSVTLGEEHQFRGTRERLSLLGHRIGGRRQVALHEASMAFSRVTFPEDTSVGGDKRNLRVIGGGNDGNKPLRVVRMANSNLRIFTWHRDTDEWVFDKFLRLPEAAGDLPGREDYLYFERNARIVAANEAYVLVTPQEKTCLFSVDLETMHTTTKNLITGGSRRLFTGGSRNRLCGTVGDVGIHHRRSNESHR